MDFLNDCQQYIEINNKKQQCWMLPGLRYYTSNRLINKKSKTKIMLVTNNKHLKKVDIMTQDLSIGHSTTIKIPGTTIHEMPDWSLKLSNHKESLFHNLKLCNNFIINLARAVSIEFEMCKCDPNIQNKLPIEIAGAGIRGQTTVLKTS